jgi:N-acetylmuramoyl-L-alanine amidase
MKNVSQQQQFSLGLFIACLIFSSRLDAAHSYVKATVRNGDGMYHLFKRYHIEANTCNINQFKKANNLRSTSKLLVGKVYNLPILKMNYNGKSIQTSVPDINRPLAVKIMNYNKAMYDKRLRKSAYTKNKEVWVVYGELYCDRSKAGGTSIVKSNKLNSSKPSLVRTGSKSTTKPESSAATLKPVNSAPATVPVSKEVKEANKGISPDMEPDEFAVPAPYYLGENENTLALKTIKVPIFGPDYQEIRIENQSLSDKIYYLVSGHGGPDPGTMYRGENITLCEDEYAYDVTLRLARKLMEQGATVHMIVQDPNDGIRNETYLPMDKDEKCITGYPLVLNQRLRLAQTTDAVNDLYRKYRNKGVPDRNQLAIHIHIDSQDKDLRKDVYFYYQDDSKYSAAIAKRLQQTLDQKYSEVSGREYTGTVSTRNLFVMRNTTAATVFMELGNIQNEADHKRIIYPNNRQALAEWLYAGIVGE